MTLVRIVHGKGQAGQAGERMGREVGGLTLATVGVRDLVFALRVHKRDTCILYLFIYMIRARPARGPNDERQRQGAGRDRHGGRGIELSPWRAKGRARVRGARPLVVHATAKASRRAARAPLCALV